MACYRMTINIINHHLFGRIYLGWKPIHQTGMNISVQTNWDLWGILLFGIVCCFRDKSYIRSSSLSVNPTVWCGISYRQSCVFLVICGSTFFDIFWGTIYMNIMNLGTTIGAKIHWLQAIAFRLPPQALLSVRCGQKSRQVWWAWVCGFQWKPIPIVLEIHRSTPLGNEIKIINWLVVSNIWIIFHFIYGIILPIDFHVFQDG
jgi:hypothetical protein